MDKHTCCTHALRDHSEVAGCLKCRCAWKLSPDGTFTMNPTGKYTAEFSGEQS